MKPTLLAIALACLAAGPGGCGDNMALLIKPVPADQTLEETQVQTDPGWVSAKIALLDVDGLLINRRTGMLERGDNPVSTLLEKLDRAGDDADVKAVVLRINSPGGTVQASETMYQAVRRFRNGAGKPVIACITDVGASGGYYVACAADRILCQPSSITGSIGVVIQTVSFAGTMAKLGIAAEAVTSGELKTMGSPLKDLTDKERKVFQAIVDEFYDRFVTVVAGARKKLPADRTRKLADGRVYTGRQALALGLVDRLGDVKDAIGEAKRAAGLDKAKVVMYHRPLGYCANVYSAAAGPPGGLQVNLLNIQGAEMLLLRQPSFLYLWSTDLPVVSGGS